MQLTVIGCGYVGLVTGGCLADAGHEVTCTDNDPAKMQMLEAGKVPIYEPGLEPVLERARKSGRLRFMRNSGEAIRAGEVIFICVGTPPTESGEALA